jgi:hypothetical protein
MSFTHSAIILTKIPTITEKDAVIRYYNEELIRYTGEHKLVHCNKYDDFITGFGIFDKDPTGADKHRSIMIQPIPIKKGNPVGCLLRDSLYLSPFTDQQKGYLYLALVHVFGSDNVLQKDKIK